MPLREMWKRPSAMTRGVESVLGEPATGTRTRSISWRICHVSYTLSMVSSQLLSRGHGTTPASQKNSRSLPPGFPCPAPSQLLQHCSGFLGTPSALSSAGCEPHLIQPQRHASKDFPASALTRPATRRDTNTSRSSSTMTQAKSSEHMKGMARRSSPSSSSCSTRNSVPRYSWYQGMEPDGFRNASMNSVQRRNDASIRSMLSNGRRKPWTRCVALHGTMHGKAQRICLPRDVLVQRKVHRRQIQAPGI